MTGAMTYVLLLSCGLAAAAWLAEHAVSALGLPRRAVWAAALVLSAALPVLALTASPSPANPPPLRAELAGPGGAAVPVAADRLAPIEPGAGIDWRAWAEWRDWAGWQLVDGAAWPAVHRLDKALALFWAATSAFALLAYAAAWLALRRALRQWPRGRMEGADVAISGRFGPAVFGLIRPRIIVPKWLLSAPRGTQSAVLGHERAHLSARDTWWLAAGMASVALMPWNPATWWQLRRLRAAIELDCDARVVRGGADAIAYARVLVDVAQRHASLGRPLPMLGAVGSTGRASQLERRVMHLIERPRMSRTAAGLGGAGAALLLAGAWAVDPPVNAQPGSAGADASAALTSSVEHDPVTGLASEGERVLVLVDVSAGMLDTSAEGVRRRLAEPAEQRRRAPKWLHVVETVESVTRRIRPGTEFQVVLFDESARAAIPGTDGRWLTASATRLAESVDALRSDVALAGESDLLAAFAAASALEPAPDIVHLIVDGLPTAGSAAGAPSASEQERMQRMRSAIESSPQGAAVNVLLMPNERDSIAAAAYWALTQRTGGGLLAPVPGTMRNPVPGIPLDAEYLAFVIDTSGSMRQYAWEAVERHIRDTLERYPAVHGLQVMTDMGEYLFQSSRGEWMADSPAAREALRAALLDWQAFSNSNPREGLAAAIEQLYEPGWKVDVFVYGDDVAQGEVDEIIDAVDRMNRDPNTGEPRLRIHSVAMPVYLEVAGELATAAQYAMLMRELSRRNGGAFIALPRASVRDGE